MALNHGTTTPIECRDGESQALFFFPSHKYKSIRFPLQFLRGLITPIMPLKWPFLQE